MRAVDRVVSHLTGSKPEGSGAAGGTGTAAFGTLHVPHKTKLSGGGRQERGAATRVRRASWGNSPRPLSRSGSLQHPEWDRLSALIGPMSGNQGAAGTRMAPAGQGPAAKSESESGRWMSGEPRPPQGTGRDLAIVGGGAGVERHHAVGWIAAGVADALEGAESEQIDLRREEAPLDRFVRRRSVLRYFLLSSGKTVTTTARSPYSFCTFSAPRKLAPEEMPTPIPSSPRQALRHQDGVTVIDGDHLVEEVEIDDRRDELVRDALDAVLADLVSGATASASSPARAGGA